MTHGSPSLSFTQLGTQLAPLHPAEVHGLLCGLLCNDPDLGPTQWIDAIRIALFGESELPEATIEVLENVLKSGAAQMQAVDDSITPLLPEDDTPLAQRVVALSHWCHGLLYGLGMGNVPVQDRLSADSQEFLRDALAISQVGFDAREAVEDDEIAYAELVEYLRVGLLTLQHDLYPIR